jgi:hypothetical protein
MNLKQKCAVCKKDLLYFRQVLMMGPKGYWRYACCEKCAAKVELKQKIETKKAGV